MQRLSTVCDWSLLQIIQTGGNNAISTCDDSSTSTSPTCGWAVDNSGNEIA